MKLSELKTYLNDQDTLLFTLPDGTRVPAHFHVTEVGEVSKNFIDCGGTLRRERVASLQLWNADDYNHRLHPEKLVHIVELAQSQLGLGDLDIEVEYQGPETISRYGLESSEEGLRLTSKHTDCLARENCGLPKAGLIEIASSGGICTPGGGCC